MGQTVPALDGMRRSDDAMIISMTGLHHADDACLRTVHLLKSFIEIPQITESTDQQPDRDDRQEDHRDRKLNW